MSTHKSMNSLERFMATYRFEPVDHLPRFGEST